MKYNNFDFNPPVNSFGISRNKVKLLENNFEKYTELCFIILIKNIKIGNLLVFS